MRDVGGGCGGELAQDEGCGIGIGGVTAEERGD